MHFLLTPNVRNTYALLLRYSFLTVTSGAMLDFLIIAVLLITLADFEILFIFVIQAEALVAKIQVPNLLRSRRNCYRKSLVKATQFYLKPELLGHQNPRLPGTRTTILFRNLPIVVRSAELEIYASLPYVM